MNFMPQNQNIVPSGPLAAAKIDTFISSASAKAKFLSFSLIKVFSPLVYNQFE